MHVPRTAYTHKYTFKACAEYALYVRVSCNFKVLNLSCEFSSEIPYVYAIMKKSDFLVHVTKGWIFHAEERVRVRERERERERESINSFNTRASKRKIVSFILLIWSMFYLLTPRKETTVVDVQLTFLVHA